MDIPRAQSTNPNSASNMSTSAKQPISSRANGMGRHFEAQNCPPSRHNGDHEHDRRFRQFGCPRADAWDNPQRPDSSEDEACPKHEGKIEHASFYSLHQICPLTDAPCVFGVVERGVPLSMSTIRQKYLAAYSGDDLTVGDVRFREEPDQEE